MNQKVSEDKCDLSFDIDIFGFHENVAKIRENC